MSVLLIHICGFVACSAVVVIGAKSLYEASQVELHEEDYDVEIPLEDRNVPADFLGLGIEIARYGLETADDVTDKIFDSRLINWFLDLIEPFRTQAEDDEDEFEGWIDESPVFYPGKHEVDM